MKMPFSPLRPNIQISLTIQPTLSLLLRNSYKLQPVIVTISPDNRELLAMSLVQLQGY